MFPLPWNFPFRKKDGTIVNVVDAMGGGGGGGSDLPDYDSSDAGKVLGVDENGDLEWSDKVNSEIQTLTNNLSDEIATRVELGAHQLLKYSLESLKANNTSGTWNDNAYTENGVTFTLNDDLTITATGTAIAQTQLVVHYVGTYDVFLKANTSYIASIYDGKGSDITFKLVTYGRNASQHTTFDIVSTNCDGQEINYDQTSIGIQFTIRIMPNFNTNGIVFKPLLKFGADASNEFTSFAMTNRELTEKIHAIKTANYISKSADSSKTWATLINEAVTELNSLLATLGSKEYLTIQRVLINGDHVNIPNDYMMNINTFNRYGSELMVKSDRLQAAEVHLASSGSYLHRTDIISSGGTLTYNYTDTGAQVPTSGAIRIDYVIFN